MSLSSPQIRSAFPIFIGLALLSPLGFGIRQKIGSPTWTPRGRCYLLVRDPFDSQLISKSGRILRRAARAVESIPSSPKPFSTSPDFVIGRNFTSWAQLALLDRRTGVVLSLERGMLVGRFSRAGEACGLYPVPNLVETIAVPFPGTEVLGSVNSPQAAALSVGKFTNEQILPELLKAPIRELAGFFRAEASRFREIGFLGKSVFPLMSVVSPGVLLELPAQVWGIQIEGEGSRSTDGAGPVYPYEVIQGIIRNETLQIWWFAPKRQPRFVIYPLAWAYDSAGKLDETLVSRINREGVSLRESASAGTYTSSDLSFNAVNLAHRRGFFFDAISSVPQTFFYLEKPIFVHQGPHAGKVGRVIEEDRDSTRGPNGCNVKRVVVKTLKGETLALSSAEITYLEPERLARHVDPVTGAKFAFVPGMKVADSTNGIHYTVESVTPSGDLLVKSNIYRELDHPSTQQPVQKFIPAIYSTQDFSQL